MRCAAHMAELLDSFAHNAAPRAPILNWVSRSNCNYTSSTYSELFWDMNLCSFSGTDPPLYGFEVLRCVCRLGK